MKNGGAFNFFSSSFSYEQQLTLINRHARVQKIKSVCYNGWGDNNAFL